MPCLRILLDGFKAELSTQTEIIPEEILAKNNPVRLDSWFI